ncbi:MAG TPA: class I SAM-dependent methyltransferase [Candidatus Paceibacterota bacterium]|nr:class I SAM-dependent methyltransferase [Candidatus Paceibacterota bacterium]
MKYKPKQVFTPWGWSSDLVNELWTDVPRSTERFKQYQDRVQREINYQCVIFAEYDWGVLVIDCCDACDWEIPIYEDHIYFKMQYNPDYNYFNNVCPFTYLPADIHEFNKNLKSMRKKYEQSKKDLLFWHRWIAVSLERFKITQKIRNLGYKDGGQFCLVSAGKGYDAHEEMGLLDPVKGREKMPWDEYFEWCCRANAIVDARGFGEFTHRMSECFGIGIPLIRPKMKNQTHEPLVPGIHYLDCGENGKNIEQCIEQVQNEATRQELIKKGMDWYSRNCKIDSLREIIDNIIDEHISTGKVYIEMDYQKMLYLNYKEKINPTFDITDFTTTNYIEQVISLGGECNELLYELIEESSSEIIVEVGSFLGSSCISMANYLKEKNKNGIIISVDTWLGSIEHHQTISRKHGYPDLYPQFLANIILRGVGDKIIPLPQTSNSASKILKKNNVYADLIYIDASHEENDVYDDIKNYWEILKDNGIIFGHDWNDFIGVNKSVEKFTLEKNIKFTTRHNYWIIRKNKRPIIFEK